MAFSSNPLSLSVPEAAFDTWLRDSGFIDILDQRTSDLHRLSSSSADSKPSAEAAASSSSSAASEAVAASVLGRVFSRAATLLSLLTLNPFAKLAAGDYMAFRDYLRAHLFADGSAAAARDKADRRARRAARRAA